MKERPDSYRDVTLVELVDRILDKGVILSGDITLSVAGIDLVYVSLRALLASVETAAAAHRDAVERGESRDGLAADSHADDLSLRDHTRSTAQ
jgi:gas vesicle structural protein